MALVVPHPVPGNRQVRDGRWSDHGHPLPKVALAPWAVRTQRRHWGWEVSDERKLCEELYYCPIHDPEEYEDDTLNDGQADG